MNIDLHRVECICQRGDYYEISSIESFSQSIYALVFPFTNSFCLLADLVADDYIVSGGRMVDII